MPLGSGAGRPLSQNSGSSRAAQQVVADQPGRQVGDAQPGEGPQSRVSALLAVIRRRVGRIWRAVRHLEAPGVGRAWSVPVEAVVLGELARIAGVPRRFRYAGLVQAMRRIGARAVATRRVSASGPMRRTRSTCPRCSPCRSTKLSIRRSCTSRPRIRGQELGNIAGAEIAGGRTAPGRRCCGSNLPGRCPARPPRRAPAAVREDAPGAHREGQSGRSGAQGVGAALEQRAAKLAFQRIDAPRHRRGVSWWRRAAAEKLPHSRLSRNRASWPLQRIVGHGCTCAWLAQPLCPALRFRGRVACVAWTFSGGRHDAVTDAAGGGAGNAAGRARAACSASAAACWRFRRWACSASTSSWPRARRW